MTRSTAELPETARRLVAAALTEFSEHGYAGTDTNRIARRAGFAPQTFYRWYADKTAIFIAAYEAWAEQEFAALQALERARAASTTLAQTIVEHHRSHLHFRRSLRLLAVEHAAVRRARADSRRRQLEVLRGISQRPEAALPAMLAETLQLERLADAIADGEFEDLGLDARAAQKTIAALIDALRGR